MGNWHGPAEFPKEIRVVRTGIGMRRPQHELRKVLAEGVNVCVASGLAGSLKKEYPVGSIVVARAIKSAGKTTMIPCDLGLIDAAVRCGAKPVDFFYTSSGIANSDAERAELARAADVVDMESFNVLTEARGSGVAAVAIRAISDSIDRKLPIDFSEAMTSDGDVALMKVMGNLVRHPDRIPSFVRFGLDSSAAIRNLTKFLDRYVRFLMTNESSYRIAAEPISR